MTYTFERRRGVQIVGCIALAALATVFLLQGLFMWPQADAPVVGWITIGIAAMFYLLLIPIAQETFTPGPILVIGPEGLLYRSFSPETIPWSEVSEIKLVRSPRRRSYAPEEPPTLTVPLPPRPKPAEDQRSMGIRFNVRDPARYRAKGGFGNAMSGLAVGLTGGVPISMVRATTPVSSPRSRPTGLTISPWSTRQTRSPRWPACDRGAAMNKNTICLWYDNDAEAAARFYARTFPDSSVGTVHKAPADFPGGGKAGQVLTVDFTVLGIPCIGLNGGPVDFKHNEAFSFQVATEDQAETDRYWNAIVGNGGQESQCGWCKDKWGISWQITPRTLTEAMAAGGAEAQRAFAAMMKMRKIDVAAIDAARRG